MMKNWWKWICLLLLMYVIIVALVVPLVPGSESVNVTSLHPGLQRVEITGYNTHFVQEEENLQCYVSIGKTLVKGQNLSVISETQAAFDLILPDTIPDKNVGFYANTDYDGTIYLSTAMRMEGFILEPNTPWKGDVITVKNEEQQFFGFPFQPNLFETIRNLMFHVPMWFTMFFLMTISFVMSIQAMNQKPEKDLKAAAAAEIGLWFCALGLITGSVWARFTWGAWWNKDPQLNGAMVVFIVYATYFILRKSVQDEIKRARLSAVFNIFAFILMILLLMVMPRMVDTSLHPGKSGNPAFSKYDLDSSLRMVFYPAVVAWGMLGYWMYRWQTKVNQYKNEENEG
jgi:heme exporter protein C